MRSLASESFWAAPVGRREVRIIAGLTLAICSVLLFARLGHHALWDDEANTALFARAIWHTGDTSARVDDHNILAYRSGAELDDELRNRRIPPLQYFVAAPFIRDTYSSFWARCPFALAGLATVALLLAWLARTEPSRRTWVLSCLAIVGNTSFFLFCRQSRYFALTLLFSALLVFAYAHREHGRRALALMAVSAVGLLGAQYLCYAGVVVALGCDYLIWGRKTAPLSVRAIVALSATQLVAIVAIVGTWYPVKQLATVEQYHWVIDRIHLWVQTLRDLNTNEFGVALLMIAAPLLFRRARDPLLRRLPVGILVATAVISLFSPQGSRNDTSDIRYVCFLIPACMLLCVRAIEALRLPGAVPIAVGLLAFQTTFLHWVFAWAFSPKFYAMPVRNTLSWYLGELSDPPPSAYTMASTWLRRHARTGETAHVLPDFAAYPLMFHAPHLTYGWQVEPRHAARFGSVPDIQLKGRAAPDWVIMFGWKRFDPMSLGKDLSALGATYELAVELPITGIDQSRPELVWHRFKGKWYSDRAPLSIWRKTSR